MCDIISDAILDACIEQDPYSRVACETVACTGYILVTGEITTKAVIDIPSIVRSTIVDIGYDDSSKGFDGNTCAVFVALDKQSPDIAQGVDESEEKSIGAGDQGMMFGYATNENTSYMPYPIWLAHQLSKRLADVSKDLFSNQVGPDGKTQVAVEYDEFGKPIRLESIVVSIQHRESVTLDSIIDMVMKNVINAVVPTNMIDDNTKIFINPTGKFVIGGPHGDAGLTGRKIIVDTYGGYAKHGGGCFSGKDCTKVDRSAAYAARYVAKNIVAAGLADKCEIQLSYAIGVESPTSISIDTFGTSKLTEDELIYAVNLNFNLTPSGIINMLDLRRPIYKQTAAYGHFGRDDLDLPWERLDKVDDLRRFVK